MKIKKILIATGSIGIIAIPTIGMLKHNNIKKDQKSNYSFSGGIAKNRTYKLYLSLAETTNLMRAITTVAINQKAKYMFSFLVNSNQYTSFSWLYGWKFLNDLLSWNDVDSLQQLLEMKNPHTWKGGFDMKDFQTTIVQDVTHNYPMSMTLWVGYKFLAHNLYGLTYTHIM